MRISGVPNGTHFFFSAELPASELAGYFQARLRREDVAMFAKSFEDFVAGRSYRIFGDAAGADTLFADGDEGKAVDLFFYFIVCARNDRDGDGVAVGQHS